MENSLLFYKVMNYPVPQPAAYFYYAQKTDSTHIEKNITDTSRRIISPIMEEYISHIQKYTRLYKSIPRVQEIYVCNSCSFNAVHEGSDIDIFIVAKTGYMRRARFWSVILFFICGQKRTTKNHAKKFCLSFYVTDDAKDIFSIAEKEDTYLVYWLAHLVPIYTEEASQLNSMYTHNIRMQKFLPNHPGKHLINTGIQVTHGKSFFKKCIEKITKGYIGRCIQKVIKRIRIPIIIYKKRKLGNTGKYVIVSDKMLKFYTDKRKIYNTLHKKNRTQSQR